jgi:putative adenylate-forming enzyme
MSDLLDTLIILKHYLASKWTLSSIRTNADLDLVRHRGMLRFRRDVLMKSPFYSQYVNEPITNIPIISKAVMLENFERINTRGIKLDDALSVALQAERDRDFAPALGDVTVGLSSGTSGRRGVFLVSKQERLRWAGIMLALALPQPIWKPHRIAFFLRANSNLYGTLNQSRSLKLDFYDLTNGTGFEREYLDRLNVTQPNVITAPASILKMLAQAVDAGKLSLKPIRIMSVAEVLEPDDEAYIEQQFGVGVHQIYQCTEGFLGLSAAPGRIVLNEAFTFIEKEWIDKASGRFVPIITDFSRVTQPIVRYRLDDVLVEDLDDVSPFTVLKRIEGRCDDVLYFRGSNGQPVPIYADAVRQAVGASGLVYNDYQIVQNALGDLDVFIDGPDIYNQYSIAHQLFENLAARFGATAPHVHIAPPEKRPLDIKRRRIERRFSIDGMRAA